MLQQDEAEDFVIATGTQYSVRDFVAAAAARLDMKIEWQGEGVGEVGIDAVSGRTLVHVDPRYFRPYRSRDPSWAILRRRARSWAGPQK